MVSPLPDLMVPNSHSWKRIWNLLLLTKPCITYTGLHFPLWKKEREREREHHSHFIARFFIFRGLGGSFCSGIGIEKMTKDRDQDQLAPKWDTGNIANWSLFLWFFLRVLLLYYYYYTKIQGSKDLGDVCFLAE